MTGACMTCNKLHCRMAFHVTWWVCTVYKYKWNKSSYIQQFVSCGRQVKRSDCARWVPWNLCLLEIKLHSIYSINFAGLQANLPTTGFYSSWSTVQSNQSPNDFPPMHFLAIVFYCLSFVLYHKQQCYRVVFIFI